MERLIQPLNQGINQISISYRWDRDLELVRKAKDFSDFGTRQYLFTLSRNGIGIRIFTKTMADFDSNNALPR